MRWSSDVSRGRLLIGIHLGTYNVNLPSWLPPTYAGRAVRFSYQLTVGACRALPGGSSSRVMKVPVRLYNHVSGMYVLYRCISHCLTIDSRGDDTSFRPYVPRRERGQCKGYREGSQPTHQGYDLILSSRFHTAYLCLSSHNRAAAALASRLCLKPALLCRATFIVGLPHDALTS